MTTYFFSTSSHPSIFQTGIINFHWSSEYVGANLWHYKLLNLWNDKNLCKSEKKTVFRLSREDMKGPTGCLLSHSILLSMAVTPEEIWMCGKEYRSLPNERETIKSSQCHPSRCFSPCILDAIGCSVSHSALRSCKSPSNIKF